MDGALPGDDLRKKRRRAAISGPTSMGLGIASPRGTLGHLSLLLDAGVELVDAWMICGLKVN
jgi:hypothetical protein